MYGAILGDIAGSIYEFEPPKEKNFKIFTEDSHITDDSILTIATADALLNNKDYAKTYKEYARDHPHAGYGLRFNSWKDKKTLKPYNSYGNGSAMRISPVGWLCETEKDVLEEAKKSASATHNHIEGIKGAQAVALAIFLARKGVSKDNIRKKIAYDFGYDLSRKLSDIKKTYDYDITCQGTVPEAIIAFCESKSFIDTIRKAIDLGGDADTLAAISGSIAEAHYKISKKLKSYAFSMVKKHQYKSILRQFDRRLER